ncbi:MAG: hypothetical protein EVA77_04650 [Phycisphaeraceae bacterium]|jgi:hypothetical protein|nr:MAG: hypothetical protein EVA77_04650 [Phycisphaeraceae bacterium]
MKSGVVLPVVLLVGVSVLLSAAGLFALSSPAAERGWQRNQLAQRQADIRSALEVLRLHLGRQREKVLSGGIPEVESSWVIRETEQGDLTLRLMDADPTGLCSPLRAESGRLDLRVTPQEWWDRVAELAPFSAVLNSARQATSVRSLMQSEMSSQDFMLIEPLLTVHAEEPELQVDGRQRLPLGSDWNNEIAARVAGRFGQAASDVLSDLFARGQMPQDVGDLVRVLQSFNVPVQDWVEILDAFAFEADLARGRIDVNTAPEAVLAAIPGIGSAAAEMVSVRSTLSDQERSTIVWPVLRGIIPAEDFDQCAVHLTTRSFRWRVDFELGLMGDDQENYLTPPDRVRCVVDLGTPRPSLAAWRSLNLDATVQGLVMEQRAQLAEEEGNASNVAQPSRRPPNRPRRRSATESNPEPSSGSSRAPARNRPPNA